MQVRDLPGACVSQHSLGAGAVTGAVALQLAFIHRGGGFVAFSPLPQSSRRPPHWGQLAGKGRGLQREKGRRPP